MAKLANRRISGAGPEHTLSPTQKIRCASVWSMKASVDTGSNAVLGAVEALQPPLKLHAGVLPCVERLHANAAVARLLQHLVTIQARHAAAMVPDDGHFLGAQLVDRNQDAAHHAAERVGHNGAGVLDELHVTLPDIHRLREQLGKARVHARDESVTGLE